ncbi:MAG: peptidylprolyl isomerase [Terricaulis sp.]
MAQYRRNGLVFAALCAVGGLAVGLVLSGCGLGRNSGSDGSGLTDPVVAATVNGRPIYIEDVRAHAVQRGILQEGEDLDANSDAFYFALEELIQFRLFAMEAEARGLDREPDVRRRLENARERVLAAAIYEEVDARATDQDAIERLYRENTARLGQGQEIHLRHIQFDTREAAEAAKRRLDQGERFEALAFEVSTDRGTAPDGGDLGFQAVNDLKQEIREMTDRTNVGQVAGPIQVENTWHLFRVEDRRERGVPSLETLRPRIVEWLRFQEISELQERLEGDARIERLRESEPGVEPGGEVTAPADDPAVAGAPTTPDAEARPGSPEPPPFPFPMGPGGVYGTPPSDTPASQAPAPAAQTPAPRPAPAAPAVTPAAPPVTPAAPPATPADP